MNPDFTLIWPLSCLKDGGHLCQAKRPRAQVLPEDPILLPEIRDQIVLVAVHPASERENEEL